MKISLSVFKIFLIYFLLIFFFQFEGFSQDIKLFDDVSAYQKNQDNKIKQKIGTKSPLIIVDGIDGEIFNSEESKKIVFYYFWYTDCGDACTSQLSLFNEMQNQYKDTVDFISITYDNKTKILEFLKSHPFHFKHYMMDENQIEMMQITSGYPTTMIVVDGIIKYWNSGGPMNSESINKLGIEYKQILDAGK
jgi:cytochrome oxidase Cu insertion factor (SCO1/SenC/PrrC family)